MYELRPLDAAPSDYYAEVPPDYADARRLAADHVGGHFAEETRSSRAAERAWS